MLAVARMSHYFGLLAAFQGQCQSCWGGRSGDAKTGVKALTFLRASLLGGHKSLLLMPLPQALPRSLVQVWGDGDH